MKSLIDKVIDDHIAMENKARAWDTLQADLEKLSGDRHPTVPVILAHMARVLDKAPGVLQTAKVNADNVVGSEGSLQLSLF
jgi:hypothetical protein